MTNADTQRLKKFIKFKNVIEIIPTTINNWPEKLSGKQVRGKTRSFTTAELGYIESALLALADTIIRNAKT